MINNVKKKLFLGNRRKPERKVYGRNDSFRNAKIFKSTVCRGKDRIRSIQKSEKAEN